MTRRLLVLAGAVVMLLAMAVPASAEPNGNANGPVEGRRTMVYVESQGLWYSSVVGPALPQAGPFQELKPGAGPGGGLATEFGPGDPGYLGGRWWIDANGSGEMDDGDLFFSCPLIGKGHSSPPAGG
jgi:hypothetical protein